MYHDEDGYIEECDWCGQVMDWRTNHRENCECKTCKTKMADFRFNREIMNNIWPELFRNPEGRYLSPKYGIPKILDGELCRKCQIELTPWVQRFADIYMVYLANMKLGRAINEQRKSRRT